jgi:glycosyltransferase involved in cell wall biosynthesis
MRIAVIEHAAGGDYTEYIFLLLEEKAKQYNYQIKPWSTSVPASQQKISDNAIVFISIESTSRFLLNWLYKIKVPSILRKLQADVVIDLNGIASSKIKIPQLIATGQFLFNKNVKQPNKIEKFALKHFGRSQKIAANVMIYSNQKVQYVTAINKEQLYVIPFTASEVFRTFEWHEKIMVKAQHADNKEYFIAVIEDEALNDFVLLLQAFSKFKKWQQSSMQLLILPKYEFFSEAITAKHKTYKYRDDVQLIEDLEEKQIAEIIASAYAFIHVATTYAQLLVLSIAMQCSLPVISFEDEDVKEYTGKAALFSNERTADALGNILIQLYKDENLHAQLKEAAKNQAANLNRKVYQDKLWELLNMHDKK